MAPDGNMTSYEDFLITEYNNIAQAHFKSIEAISNFFKYYLLVMSVPITIIGVLYRIANDEKISSSNIISSNQSILVAALIVISLVGAGVFIYVINLRLDVILYARTVNSIRKHFYDKAELETHLRLRFKVLPQSPSLPSYKEESFFLPVVFVFALLNTAYFALALYVFWGIIESICIYPKPIMIIISVLFFILHFIVYLLYARHRETGYLRSNIVGVDIDGVMNMHKEHFCELLKSSTGKELASEKITIIPVNEAKNSSVTRGDECVVFNDPRYWTDMPVVPEVPEILRRLRNTFKMKIFIFTYRPWPDSPDKATLMKQKVEFWKAYNHFFLFSWICWILSRSKITPLRGLTRKWLDKHKIPYDRLIIEKGNDYSSDPFSNFKNRFYVSRKKMIRYFVEDDIEKAIKLSFICDIVFLISQPYNEPSEDLPEHLRLLRENLPSNVLRVKEWIEIYQNIRLFS